jgi:hypothetical protein
MQAWVRVRVRVRVSTHPEVRNTGMVLVVRPHLIHETRGKVYSSVQQLLCCTHQPLPQVLGPTLQLLRVVVARVAFGGVSNLPAVRWAPPAHPALPLGMVVGLAPVVVRAVAVACTLGGHWQLRPSVTHTRLEPSVHPLRLLVGVCGRRTPEATACICIAELCTAGDGTHPDRL